MSETHYPHPDPHADLDARLAELDHLTTLELRERHAELFGEPARSGNAQWLRRRLAWRIQELALGGLSERARRRAGELARDADLRVRPPRDRGGPLRASTGRLARRDDRVPIAGTVLTRVHKGVEHRVLVLPKGFEHEGRVHRSLSAVAHAITGSHWNGFHFFGLDAPRKAKTNTTKEHS